MRTSRSVSLYVSAHGSDVGEGSRAHPFATLERARDAVRELKRARGGLPKWGVAIGIDGVLALERTFELGPEDSGTAQAPVEYRARGPGRAALIGGRVLGGFVPVTDAEVLARLEPAARGRVLQCDLRACGVSDFGRLRSRGFGRAAVPAHLELFHGGKAMTLARWPNAGEWTRIAGIPEGAAVGDDHGRQYGRLDAGFHYEGDRPARWRVRDDVWVHGYWAWEWANSYERVAEFDLARRFLRTDPPHGLYGFRPGQRFFYLNVLDELDQPGEYFVDRRSGLLYFWPPEGTPDPNAGETRVSVLEGPLVSLRGVEHVLLRGLMLECARGTGVRIEGGVHNRMEGCIVRLTGNHAVEIAGGSGHWVAGCDLHDNGDAGVLMSGGDRATLTPATHHVHNCHFRGQGRWSRCYVPAIGMSGVGLVATNNLIHDHPHIAVLFTGNDHLIEANEIHHVCIETGDTGAIYSGRDWTFQGNVIRHNYIHDVREPGWGGSFCVYLDDGVSGITVEGNIIADSNTGVLLGGGRDCVIRGNLFLNCKVGVRIDARGLDEAPVWRDMVQRTMRERLEAVGHRRPPYSLRYPGLAALDAHLALGKGVPPENDAVTGNVCVGGEWLKIHWHAVPEMFDLSDNVARPDGEEIFADPARPARKGFRLRRDGAAPSGFVAIPFRWIGLQCDALRASAGGLRR
jgi:parallel beta-helix repeat protein